MGRLAILPTIIAAPADYSDSESGIVDFQASRKAEEATHQQPPVSSTSDKGFEERSGLARSRLTKTNDGGHELTKARRKSTGSILTCISALQCLLTASPDPKSGPPYVERFRPLNSHPPFQIQLKSNTRKEAPNFSRVSASLPADGVPDEAFVSIDINGTNAASKTSWRLNDGPRSFPRSQFNLPACSNELDQVREVTDTPSHYSNEFFEVKRSDLSGLGAFALQDLKNGQRIMTEPALLMANTRGIYDEYDKLAPGQQQAYNSLCSNCPGHATGLERIRSIYDTNSFNMGHGLCGVYLVTARFNHACPPARNIAYSFDGAKQDITLRMTKDVTAGTELTLTYATCSTMLYLNWGFVCSCGGCTPLSQEELASINTPPTW